MSVATPQQAHEALLRVSARVAPPRADEVPLPVLAPLRPLLPGLRRGQVLTVEGAGSLALALVAGASATGSWCGVVGLPERGVLAAVAMGCEVGRLLLVDEPGERWVEVVAALLEGVDVVLVRPPVPAPPAVARRLTALARRSGSCLVVVGSWEGAQLRLRVVSSLWTGVGQGHGRLRGRRVKVEAQGRGVGGRPRSAWLWLPGPDGSVGAADLTSVGPERAAPSAGALVGTEGASAGMSAGTGGEPERIGVA